MTAWLIGPPSTEGLPVIAYRATLDVPRELVVRCEAAGGRASATWRARIRWVRARLEW